MTRRILPCGSEDYLKPAEQKYVYHAPEKKYELFPLEDQIQEMLDFASEVVLDPSALPFLPQFLQHSQLGVRVPLVLYQLLSVRRDDVPPATIPDVPEPQQTEELLGLAQRTVRRWVSPRRKISWDHIRLALESPRCKPISAIKEATLEIQDAARVRPDEAVEARIEGVGTDLVGLVLGQELAGAAEEEIPIVGANERPLVKLASRFLSMWITRGPGSLVDRKQTYFDKHLKGLPKRTRDLRWFTAFVLAMGGFFPPFAIPAGVGGFALMIVDP